MEKTYILVSLEKMESITFRDLLTLWEFINDQPTFDLSDEAIEEKATELYTTHSIIGNNTMVLGPCIEGYKRAIKDLLNK